MLNGYPIVYADTGNYLAQALKHIVGWNAPPFYSIFLLATDWRISLWLPILVQGLIATHLLSLVLRQFGWYGPWPTLLTCLFLAATTSLPWFVSFATPYVFIAFVVLSLWLLAFGAIGRWERRYLSLLAIGSVAVHFSHVPLSIGLSILGGIVAAFYWGARAGLRAFGRMVLAPAVVVVMLMLMNLVAHGTASVAPYGSVLLAARMLYDGTARDYLAAACPARQFKICPYIDSLPEDRDDFLFNLPPLNPTLGGAKAWTPEAREIVAGTIAYEPGAVIRAALDNTVRLFGHLYLGEALQPWVDEPGPEPLLRDYFPARELAAFKASAQSQGLLQDEVAMTKPMQVALAWAGMVALVVLLYVERRSRMAWTLCLLVLASVMANAFITAALSGIEDHYEARIAWLAVFVPLVLVSRRAVPARDAQRRLTAQS